MMKGVTEEQGSEGWVPIQNYKSPDNQIHIITQIMK